MLVGHNGFSYLAEGPQQVQTVGVFDESSPRRNVLPKKKIAKCVFGDPQYLSLYQKENGKIYEIQLFYYLLITNSFKFAKLNAKDIWPMTNS